MRISYDVAIDDLVEFNRRVALAAMGHQRWLFPAGLAAFGGWLGWLGPTEGLNRLLDVIVGVAVGLVVYGFLLWIALKMIDRKVRRLWGTDPSMVGFHRLSIENGYLREETAVSEQTYAAGVLLRVDRSEAHISIFVNPIAAAVIPRERVIEGDAEEFADAVEAAMSGA